MSEPSRAADQRVSRKSTSPTGFDPRTAAGHTAEILAIFAALVIPVLFIAASTDFETALRHVPVVNNSNWLLVSILLLCAAFIGLASAAIGLLGLAGDASRKSSQVPSTMALYAEATCGFIALLSAAEVYGSSLQSRYVEWVLVCLVAGVALVGCMIVATLLVESSAVPPVDEPRAWIGDGGSGIRHFFVITCIAAGALLGLTIAKLAVHFSPGGKYPVWAAVLLTAVSGVLLPVNIIRSLPRKKVWIGAVKRGEAYAFGLLPALAAIAVIVGLPFY